MHRKAFKEVKRYVLDVLEWQEPRKGLQADIDCVKGLRIRKCGDIDLEAGKRETFEEKRAYAHYGCTDGAICVAGDFMDLPAHFRIGILLHEIGHACAMNYNGKAYGEPEADLWVKRVLGITIHYDDIRELEYVSGAVVRKVKSRKQ